MAKVKSVFFIKNNLDEYVTRELGRKMSDSGIKSTKSVVFESLAEYSGCGVENIRRINRNVQQPSLVVALRLAQYFEVHVEDIFKVN